MRYAVVAIVIAVLLASGRTATQVADGARDVAAASVQRTAAIPLGDARRVVDAVSPSPSVPLQLAAPAAAGWVDAWNEWLRQHESTLRRRLDRGDEDSVVNLWMFGTSFTRLPPARNRDLPQDGASTLDDVLADRLDDLLEALTSSRPNERLAFVREFLTRHQADPATRGGREAARRLLVSARARALDEFARTDAVLTSAARGGDRTAQLETVSTIFKDRGLSSDTSLLVGAGIDAALQALRASGVLGASSVRRVAIIGPGLDFMNKADGHDFYPQQTVQPFALIDSLLRHGLSNARDLQVTTIDVSPRVNQHLRAMRVRALGGETYLLHLPLPRGERWTPHVRAFWREVGNRIGTAATPLRVPESDNADVRAINVRPYVVAMLDPVEADIVSSRLVASGDGVFDLIVATNVFVYYSPFEQALAAANVASMLRGGGFFLSNNDVPVSAPMKSSVGHVAVKYSDRQNDQVFAYQRQ